MGYGVLLEAGHSCRVTFIIDPKGVIRHMSMNDPPVGRNVDEVLRLVKGYQHFEQHGVVCPAKWKSQSDRTIKPDPTGKLKYFSAVNGNDKKKKKANTGNNKNGNDDSAKKMVMQGGGGSKKKRSRT